MKLSISLLIVLAFFSSLSAQAKDDYFGQKQANKRGSGWTLEEWLNTKERNRLMDQWLMLHSSPNLYEFYLGYEADSYIDQSGESFQSSGQIQAMAFATIVGLEGHLAPDGNGWDASLRLRLLGSSDQGTNLTLGYGLRERDAYESLGLVSQASASLSLQITQVVGIFSDYYWIMPKQGESLELLGHQEIAAGIYLDFSFFRLYGKWFQQESGLVDTPARQGYIGGLGFYF